MNTNLVREAQIFATAAHGAINQKRKYTGEPYIKHPEEVVRILCNATAVTDEMIAAAWLHDVVEDTAITLETIQLIFGHKIAFYVEQLTDVSKPEDGNRAARKAIDLAHTAKCVPETATIKLADLISNTQSIAKLDPNFARVYIPEKVKTLAVLTHGDKFLHTLATRICISYLKDGEIDGSISM